MRGSTPSAAIAVLRSSESVPPMMSVSIGPGAIAFTVIPRWPSSRAMPRVSPMTPAFATEYGVLLNVPPPRWAETDDRLTMRPYPCWTIDCAARGSRSARRRG